MQWEQRNRVQPVIRALVLERLAYKQLTRPYCQALVSQVLSNLSPELQSKGRDLTKVPQISIPFHTNQDMEK